MNFHIINIIIKREYLTRVKKKSFLIITFLAPVLMAAICILPSVLMYATKEKAQKIAVVDASGIVMSHLENSKTLEYSDVTGMDPETVKSSLEDLGFDVLLNISALDSVAKTVSATTYSIKPLGVETSEVINSRINDAIEAYRVSSYDINGLDDIMNDVRSNMHMTSYTLGEDGSESLSSSEVYMIVSMLLGMIIYMFIAMFSGMVMSSVIEEKASRVVEVLTSSVKATELMFGKIIGVALVAITQFLLWIALTGVILGAVTTIFGADLLTSSASAQTEMMSMGTSMGGVDASEMIAAATAEPTQMEAIMTTVKDLPFLQLGLGFLVYFILGYLLYASLFAAIGSAVENEADTQQLQLPITIPLLIGFFIAFYAFKSPDSALVFWGSMIPFTSPIVMMARIPFGVPVWQLALSIVLLLGTFVACGWASAKIYKVGILMFGKKNSFKDLWKWFKQD